MRWLFLLLLVANVLIYFWGVNRNPQPLPQAGILENAGMGNLRLLSELEKEDGVSLYKPSPTQEVEADMLQSAPSVPAVSAASTEEGSEDPAVPSDEPDAATDSLADPGDMPAPVETTALGRPEEAEPDGAEHSVLNPDEQISTVDQPEVSPEPVEEIPVGQALPYEQGAAVVELGESSPEIESAVVDVTPIEAAPKPEPIPVKEAYCGILGPLEEQQEAQTIVAEMTARDIEASLRQAPIQKPKGYWVMIPPMTSQGEAVKRFNAIKSKGVTDMRRFVQGEYKNGISFGVFSRQVNALNRQQSLKKKGVEVDIVPRYSEITGYWIDFKAFSESFTTLSEALQEQYPQQKIEKQGCPRIVTQ